ncbi:lipid II-degrading bacteriocin [Luteibacter jiangsuensis]
MEPEREADHMSAKNVACVRAMAQLRGILVASKAKTMELAPRFADLVTNRWLLVALELALLGVVHPANATKTVSYYYADMAGNITRVTDSSGALLEVRSYRPYGQGGLGMSSDGPGYSGAFDDADTGLVYMAARYYDPLTKRFISVDPARHRAGSWSGADRYAYANNNPLAWKDATGAFPLRMSEADINCAVYACVRTGGDGERSSRKEEKQRFVYMSNVPTYDQAKAHYRSNTGDAIRIPISALDLSELTNTMVRDTLGVQKAIASAGEGVAIGDQFDVQRSSIPYETPGEQYKVLGSITLVIWGHVTYTGGSSWTFDGRLKAYDDVYDFDMQWSRPMRSILTAGAKLDHGEGKGFDIQIRGSAALHTDFEK